MTLKDIQQVNDLADLIGKGFNSKPFTPLEEVTLKWDLELKTHITVMSVLKYSLREDLPQELVSQSERDAIKKIHDDLQYILPSSGRIIKDIECKFGGINVLMTMLTALYVGKMKNEHDQDVLPDKKELIKFLDGFLTKIKRA